VTKADVVAHMEGGAAARPAATAPAAAPAAARPALPGVPAPINVDKLLPDPAGTARADVALARTRGRAPAAVPGHCRDPHHLQRNQHAAGDGTCAPDTRTSSRKNMGVKLGFMSFFRQGRGVALKKYPIVNASSTAMKSSITVISILVSGGQPARAGGAGAARRRPDEFRADREDHCGSGQARPARGQALHGGAHRRHFLHFRTAAFSARCCPPPSSTRRNRPFSASTRPRSGRWWRADRS